MDRPERELPDPLLEALIELARSAERNAAVRAGRRLTVVEPPKRRGRAA